MKVKKVISLAFALQFAACQITEVSEDLSPTSSSQELLNLGSSGNSSESKLSSRGINISSMNASSQSTNATKETKEHDSLWGPKYTLLISDPSQAISIDLDQQGFETIDTLAKYIPFENKRIIGRFNNGIKIKWNTNDIWDSCEERSNEIYYGHFTSLNSQDFDQMNVDQAFSTISTEGSKGSIDSTGYGLFIDANNRIIKIARIQNGNEVILEYFIGPKAELNHKLKNSHCTYFDFVNITDTSDFIPRAGQRKPTFNSGESRFNRKNDSLGCEGFAIRKIVPRDGVHPKSENESYFFYFEMKAEQEDPDDLILFPYTGIRGIITHQNDTLWDAGGEKGTNWSYGQMNNSIYAHHFTWDQQKHPLDQVDKIMYNLGGLCTIPLP
jgi:hypothetical protein